MSATGNSKRQLEADNAAPPTTAAGPSRDRKRQRITRELDAECDEVELDFGGETLTAVELLQFARQEAAAAAAVAAAAGAGDSDAADDQPTGTLVHVDDDNTIVQALSSKDRSQYQSKVVQALIAASLQRFEKEVKDDAALTKSFSHCKQWAEALAFATRQAPSSELLAAAIQKGEEALGVASPTDNVHTLVDFLADSLWELVQDEQSMDDGINLQNDDPEQPFSRKVQSLIKRATELTKRSIAYHATVSDIDQAKASLNSLDAMLGVSRVTLSFDTLVAWKKSLEAIFQQPKSLASQLSEEDQIRVLRVEAHLSLMGIPPNHADRLPALRNAIAPLKAALEQTSNLSKAVTGAVYTDLATWHLDISIQTEDDAVSEEHMMLAVEAGTHAEEAGYTSSAYQQLKATLEGQDVDGDDQEQSDHDHGEHDDASDEDDEDEDEDEDEA
ncbi:hypothetical protein CAOG_01529 [Capsaspora owczarzaki ATCC 30864]|uniref:Uncharacterized protein n=1 Tax=Capsaspora owczarzaki (strain ATCC 30864) TaxID=595528 RepID=A0A0D2X148_CAPO3|nr:hypothetical protein CAOG_01529 [Capsaspora owczarzaki ATCC 30864]KJE90184.1 hypothetical protein CAOG_001529 [Capsaspora owczarzaki ATCC 30864]|eukprot:XP_004364397.1 hypothetical protein CAOG_01529 [Capsaspora owczarzaki ATCC 30864]